MSAFGAVVAAAADKTKLAVVVAVPAMKGYINWLIFPLRVQSRLAQAVLVDLQMEMDLLAAHHHSVALVLLLCLLLVVVVEEGVVLMVMAVAVVEISPQALLDHQILAAPGWGPCLPVVVAVSRWEAGQITLRLAALAGDMAMVLAKPVALLTLVVVVVVG